MPNRENPLVIQSDYTVLLEVDNPHFEDARAVLSTFAELLKSPEYFHTYRITPISLWNAAASKVTVEQVLQQLEQYSKYEIPVNVKYGIADYMQRYGRLKLHSGGSGSGATDNLILQADDALLLAEIRSIKSVAPLLGANIDSRSCRIDLSNRGLLKSTLIAAGFPVEDLAGYSAGDPLVIELAAKDSTGNPFALREYQRQAVESFYAGGRVEGGSGIIVMPCGAGKTIVGIGVMAKLQTETLILSTNITAVRQWIEELCEKTTLPRTLIGEYTGEQKQILPVTITTYQMLTHRTSTDEDFPHLTLFNRRNWGLIIYDEVHLLPAPVFRVTAGLQARRRLGLTATLIREDGREGEVFSLIGPKKYDAPWKNLEKQGWIAAAICREIRVPLDPEYRLTYVAADRRNQFRVASENPQKAEILQEILRRHRDDRVLIIGQYLSQLEEIARLTGAPLITGRTNQSERDRLYECFRNGEISILVVSKVANFAVDLPDANVAIQISGTFGSRQEEAQRLGRILRPKSGEDEKAAAGDLTGGVGGTAAGNSAGGTAYFYTLVSRDTVEVDFAMKRQLFLVEQGYEYHILEMEKFYAAKDVAGGGGRGCSG